MEEKEKPEEKRAAEEGRRPNGVAVEGVGIPTSEVETKRTRRRHTLAYKIRVLETVSALRTEGGGAVGSYLRKEGLYYSTVRRWARLQSEGELTAREAGGKGKSREALQAEIQQLRRKLDRTEEKLRKTELIVELQKKLSSILVDSEETNSGKRGEK